MYGEFTNIEIKGICSAVPQNSVNNREFYNHMSEKRRNRLMSTVGVECRHLLCGAQTVTDLACHCGSELLKKTAWNPKEIKVLVYVTQMPEFESPATAMYIQKQLGIGTDCIVFDVNLGCSGYVAGLQIVSALLQNCEDGRKGILIVGDGANLERKSEADGVLFGDAAAATAIEKVDSADRMLFIEQSDGKRYDALLQKRDEILIMDGEAVFNFTLNEVAESINSFRNLKKVDSIDYYVFHQAQKMILDNLGDLCGIEPDKNLHSYEEFGNTSSVSIPLTICFHKERWQNKKNSRFYLCGFGVGLAWGSIVCSLDENCVIDILYTDELFK